MKKTVLIIVGAIIVAALAAIGGFAYYNVNREADVVTVEQTDEIYEEAESEEPASVVLASGQFQDADAVHKGEGTAQIVQRGDRALLEFKDFSVTRGPDLFVYLSPNSADEGLGDFVSLGLLKEFEGNQTYNLPDNYEDYKTVVIWCRAFSVKFATAELE